MILLDNTMFQDDSKIDCYNLFVSSENGTQMWDVDIVRRRYPRLYKVIEDKFNKNVLSFDFKNINFSLG